MIVRQYREVIQNLDSNLDLLNPDLTSLFPDKETPQYSLHAWRGGIYKPRKRKVPVVNRTWEACMEQLGQQQVTRKNKPS